MSGVEPIIIASLIGGGAAVASSKIASSGAAKAPSSPAPMPKAPDVSVAQSAAQDVVRKKKASLTKSIYTSPLGIAGQANIAKKTLLGE